MEAKADQFGADLMRFVEKSVLLQTLDAVWKEHLLVLDQLRQGIYLRSYGQRDPLNEYKSEAFALFNAMLDDLKQRVTSTVTGLQLQAEPPQPPPLPAMMWENHPEAVLDAPAFTMAASEPVEVHDPAGARGRGDDRRPGDLAQHAAQRAMPLRVGQEVQALPRPGRVAGLRHQDPATHLRPQAEPRAVPPWHGPAPSFS